VPRAVESFAIGKPVREPLSPPTEGTHFVPTYTEIVS